MALDRHLPYNDLPLLPPRTEVETRRVLKACIAARAAVAELKAAGRLLPNQGILIHSIPLLEARASSEIESIVTTTDQLLLFDDLPEAQADPATKEALRYRTALWDGFDALKKHPLTTRTAVQVCRAIKSIELDIRRTPGTALINDRSRQVIYTPPEGETLLRDKLANWEQWMHGTLPDTADIDPLVRMAVGHYQFEAIHPFADGNGRTGRILNLLFLVDQGLLDLPVLYLSRHILNHRQQYYDGLLAVTTEGRWEEWILFLLEGVTETARWTMERINAMRDLLEATAERIRIEAASAYSRELAEMIFVRPYCRIAHLVDAGIAKRQTASLYLKQLVDAGILVERKVGREKLFLNAALVGLLRRE